MISAKLMFNSVNKTELEKLIGTLNQKRKRRIVQIMKGRQVEEVTVDEE